VMARPATTRANAVRIQARNVRSLANENRASGLESTSFGCPGGADGSGPTCSLPAWTSPPTRGFSHGLRPVVGRGRLWRTLAASELERDTCDTVHCPTVHAMVVTGIDSHGRRG